MHTTLWSRATSDGGTSDQEISDEGTKDRKISLLRGLNTFLLLKFILEKSEYQLH